MLHELIAPSHPPLASHPPYHPLLERDVQLYRLGDTDLYHPLPLPILPWPHPSYHPLLHQLYRLADADLQAEYGWYTSVYLADDTPEPIKGMCEMTLIKLGEVTPTLTLTLTLTLSRACAR